MLPSLGRGAEDLAEIAGPLSLAGYVEEQGSSPVASLFGSGRKVSVADAVLVNATAPTRNGCTRAWQPGPVWYLQSSLAMACPARRMPSRQKTEA